MTVTDPESIHLKYISRGEDLFLKQVVDLQVSEEGGTLGVEDGGLAIGDVDTEYGCLPRAEINNERTLVGRWHMIQEPGDYGGYF